MSLALFDPEKIPDDLVCIAWRPFCFLLHSYWRPCAFICSRLFSLLFLIAFCCRLLLPTIEPLIFSLSSHFFGFGFTRARGMLSSAPPRRFCRCPYFLCFLFLRFRMCLMLYLLLFFASTTCFVSCSHKFVDSFVHFLSTLYFSVFALRLHTPRRFFLCHYCLFVL